MLVINGSYGAGQGIARHRALLATARQATHKRKQQPVRQHRRRQERRHGKQQCAEEEGVEVELVRVGPVPQHIPPSACRQPL